MTLPTHFADLDIALDWHDPDVLLAANIIPTTRLATDYLNIFNEVVMLFGLLPDMPEMMDDLRLWQFLSYEQHFARSGLQTKDLAILAYQHAEPDLKQVFDTQVDVTRTLVTQAIDEAMDIMESGSDLAAFCTRTTLALNEAIATLDGLVHGRPREESHLDIDALFGD